MPPNTCMGMCNKSCKNNCPLNKHIWMRDYCEPPAELYLVIDLYKLTNYDIHYIKKYLPHIMPEIRAEYKQIKKKEALDKLDNNYHIDYTPEPKIMKKPKKISKSKF